MSEQDVVAKVGDLMQTLDDVKRYKELAYAMIDFAAIIIVSVIAVIALTMIQNFADIVYGFPNFINGQAYLLFDQSFPASPWILLCELSILIGGLLFGVVWVDRRVGRTRVGEWKETLNEGVPGAVKLLSNIEWDSLLGTVSLARVAYLFYALIKVAGYFLLASFILSFIFLFSGFLFPAASSLNYVPFIALTIVLLFTRKSVAEGFRKLRSLDFSGTCGGFHLSSREQNSTRPDLYVLARIIKALSDKGPTKRTALATATGIAYDRLVLYLDWMISRGFVTLDADGSVQLTAAGMQAYDQVVRWIIQHVGQLRLPRPRPPEET